MTPQQQKEKLDAVYNLDLSLTLTCREWSLIGAVLLGQVEAGCPDNIKAVHMKLVHAQIDQINAIKLAETSL